MKKDPLALLRRFPFLQTVMHAVLERMPGSGKARARAFSRMYWLLIRHATNCQGTLRVSQALATTLGSLDTWDLGIRQADWIAQQKQDAIANGLIVDDGGDLGCGGTFEGGHLGYLEGIILYNSQDPASMRATDGLVRAGIEGALKHSLGVPIAGFGVEANRLLGPACHDYHLWMARIKKALDPHTACDPFFYAEPETEEDKEP